VLEQLNEFLFLPKRAIGAAGGAAAVAARAARSAARLPRRIRQSEFAAAAAVRAAYWVCTGWMWIFLPLYFLSAGFTLVETGALVTALVLPRILSNGPFGVLTDFKSPKRVALAATAAMTLGFAAFYFAAIASPRLSLEAMLALVLALGFCMSVAEVSTTSLAFKRVSDARRGRDVGLLEFSKAAAIGVSLLFAGFLFAAVGYATGFAAFAVGMALVFVACALVARDYKGAVAERAYWRSFATREIILLFAVMLLVSFHFGVENSTMSVYSQRVLGLGDGGVGALFAITIFGYAVFNYFSGKRLDNPALFNSKHLKTSFVIGLAFSAVGFTAFGFTSDFAVAVAFRLMHELGDALILVYALYSLTRIGGASRIGGLNGFYVTLTTIGSAFGSFGAGLIAAAVGGNAGLTASFVVASLLTLAGGALLLAVNSGSLFSSRRFQAANRANTPDSS